MDLTDEQKELTLDMFNEDPNIINITKKVFEVIKKNSLTLSDELLLKKYS